ncbi:MAG TPA: response regulator [Pyrinomonadaceae bacterium]|jgi:DNA-binding NtrC family response regulator
MPVTRILVVDDEAAISNAWQRALRNAGYFVRTANTANSALTLCEEHSFDVVILDYLMPTMRGSELLTRIRRIQPMIRSILVSGQLDTDIDENTLSADLKQKVEADIYFHKPVSNQRLREAIASLSTDDPLKDWKKVADRTLQAKKVTIKGAKATAKDLDKLRKNR